MQNAKAVELQQLETFQQKYEGDALQKAMRHALNKNAISAIANVETAYPKNKFHFSIDIPTMKVANQQASGRC